jgi:hypothetical protein
VVAHRRKIKGRAAGRQGIRLEPRRISDVPWSGGLDMNKAGLPLTDLAIAEMTDEQRAILHELGQYAAQELNLSKQIRETSEEVKHAMAEAGFSKSERPSLLHEDPEVDVLISAKSRHKITNVQSQIRRTLERAVQVGLGRFRIIREQCANYGVDCPG